VDKLNFSPETEYTEDSWKTGDAILYNNRINPLLDQFTPDVTINSGTVDPTMAGKIENVGGYNYPNIIFKY